MRLGELLVQAGLLSMEQVEQALRAQVMWGGRLGTNLIELGFLDLDVLSRVIARQHQLPAAFADHFAAADTDLQRLLSPELAAKYACIPLRRAGERVVIASVAALDGRARAMIADQLRTSHKNIVSAIAAELRVHYHLERVYGIPRDTRFLRSRKRSTMPSFEINVDDFDDGPLVDRTLPPPPPKTDAVPQDELLPDFTPRIEIEEVPGRERRRYIPRLGEEPAPVGRIELKRHAAGSVQLRTIKAETLEEATRAIRRSEDREAIAERVVQSVVRFVPATAATLLVVRGDTATSWTGDIAVPLDEPNLVATALDEAALLRSQPTSALDALLLHTLGAANDDLVVAPITLGAQVWSLLVFAVKPGAGLDGVVPIAQAASAAFGRLLRNANR